MTANPIVTEVSSDSKAVRISSGNPVVMIGERINPTNRAELEAGLREGDMDVAIGDAKAQVRAGAEMLDVNVGLPSVDEPALMAAVVQTLQAAVDVPLSLDSRDAEALQAGLQAYQGKPLVNSVTGEEASLSRVLPLVAEHGAAVVGLLMDDDGIPMDAEKRLAIAERIVVRAGEYGIFPADVVIDPLVLAVGADTRSARVTLKTIRLVRDELGLNMTLGLSNVSHGLPGREELNTALVAMAIARGVTCPIVNPLQPEVRDVVLAANLLLGHDEWAMHWIKQWRAKAAD